MICSIVSRLFRAVTGAEPVRFGLRELAEAASSAAPWFC
jgi:hypothetical protein